MFVVAGPPGSGKSTIFPVASFQVAHFNADDRAAELNGGNYRGIPASVRAIVSRQFEAFVDRAIQSRESFAIETTLRSDVTFRQAADAKAAGFRTEMRFLALSDFSQHLERVKVRADTGGHSASEKTLLRIHQASLQNLSAAIRRMDRLWVYDNSTFGGPPRLLLYSEHAEVAFLDSNLPSWIAGIVEEI